MVLVTRPFAAYALSLAVLLSLPTIVAGADPAADIPGVPLPGPIITGRLGGPIYDRVFQVDVPAQRVLVLSLAGSSGTDFDLYLFDASATSVYATTGLVAKSTGPTSTESINYSTVSGGRFYIDLSGFTEIEGDFRLTVAIGLDGTPPRAVLTLDGGAPATNDRDAAVSVVATDDLSGVVDMQFSGDGLIWEAWQPYAPTSHRTLSDGDGRKDVWVRVRDGQGNLSAPAHGSIMLDRTAPTVVSRNPEPGGSTPASGSVLSVRFSEPIRTSSWLSFGLILQDSAGTIVYGSYAWDASTNTGTFVPATDLQVGALYVVSLGTIVDVAGNSLASPGRWIVRPLQEPVITLSASPRVAARGATIQLAGSVVDAAGGVFTLERLESDGNWIGLEPLLPDATGRFFSKQVVDQNSSFRVTYSGNDVSAAAISPGVRVLVRRSVSVAGPGPTVLRSASVGQLISVTATLGPTAPAIRVTLTLARYDPVRRVYRTVTRLTQTSSSGHAIFRWRPSSAARYLVRLSTAATDAYASGLSGSYRWIVR
jgi:hypothetical protein